MNEDPFNQLVRVLKNIGILILLFFFIFFPELFGEHLTKIVEGMK